MRKLVGTIVIVLFIVAGVGYSRGWFSFSRSGGPGNDDMRVSVSIDKGKARGDIAQASEKLREMTQDARQRPPAKAAAPPASGATASGKIVGLDPAGSLTIATDDGRQLEIQVPDAAGVTVDGLDANSGGLRSGDRVVVQYTSAEGTNIATELSVTTRPS